LDELKKQENGQPVAIKKILQTRPVFFWNQKNFLFNYIFEKNQNQAKSAWKIFY
jgi:hypothetical protein